MDKDTLFQEALDVRWGGELQMILQTKNEWKTGFQVKSELVWEEDIGDGVSRKFSRFLGRLHPRRLLRSPRHPALTNFKLSTPGPGCLFCYLFFLARVLSFKLSLRPPTACLTCVAPSFPLFFLRFIYLLCEWPLIPHTHLVDRCAHAWSSH